MAKSSEQATKAPAVSSRDASPFFKSGDSSAPFFQPKLTVNAPGDRLERGADRAADRIMAAPAGHAPQSFCRAPQLQRQPDDQTGKVLSEGLVGPVIQAKLTIGDPDDRFEEEADATADRVVQRMHAGTMHPGAAPSVPPIQTKCAECGEEERVQRQAEAEDAPDRLLLAKAEGSMEVPGSVEHALTGGGTGGGAAMHPALRDEMESAFEVDFSGVRIHTGPAAEHLSRNLSARAFTYGRDIFFNADEYRPETPDGRHLLAHELTHVVQQNDAVHTAREEEGDEPKSIQASTSRGVIQRDAKKKGDYVLYRIRVDRPMTPEMFQDVAMRQIFGGVVTGLDWHNTKASYVPGNSPYPVEVELQLLQKARGEAGRERGITVGSGGGITGAAERAKTFHAGAESDEKTALMNEIDDRYFKAVGDPTQTKIKPGEKGNAALWRMIRDEVLFQHEYIKNLPPSVKELIKVGTSGRDLTPADYDKLFAIAKKIEKMPAGQASDYASKVTGSTTDLNVFEASLDKYIAEAAARDKQTEERDKIQTKLLGLEEFYKRYRFRLLGGGGATFGPEARREFDREIRPYGFANLAEFEEYIKKFESVFEAGAASIAKDLLAKFAGKMYRESERYNNPAQVHALHQQLAGMRVSFAEFEANAPIWNRYAEAKKKADEQRSIPGQGHVKTSDYTDIAPDVAQEALKKAEAAKASAKSQFEALAKDHPVFQEEGLPDGKKLDKTALARASESQLRAILQAQIRMRMGDAEAAKAEIDGKPELIYKLDKLMPQFYALQGIRPGSIHDQIIQDKMRSDAVTKIVKGIAVAIVAIALAVVTFGTATPAIIAAGAAIAGASLSAYQAYESYQEYVEEKKLADVGLAKDPSIVWLVIAVAGAALDIGAAVKAVKALGPAAKALEAGGELADFTKVVRTLEREQEITASVARAADRAGNARKALATSFDAFSSVLSGKVYNFPGALADPDVYKALVALARDAIRVGAYDAAKFLEQIKLARVKAQLKADLAPEELAKVKQAWEEAKALEVAEQGAAAAAGFRLTRVPYGQGALSKLAQRFRVSLNLRSGGNVAVFEFTNIPDSFRKLAARLGGKNVVIEGNLMAVQNVGGAAHSEELARDLIKAGRQAKMELNVRSIYTEYNPCTDTCLPLIRENFPNVDVTYSFTWESWGRQTPERNAAVEALFKAQTK